MLAEVPETLLPRGAGMAYGDAALNGGQGTLETLRLDRILALDESAATVTCEGGVPLRDLVEVALRRGLFPAVTPGTWKSAVGGCVACDVHGKNHHVAGSFLDHLLRFRLALADGRVVECSRGENADLFHATAGGMGLSGVVLDATFRLQRVASAWMRVRHLKNRDLDATFAALERPQPEPYSVAWRDVLARGGRLGRSVLIGIFLSVFNVHVNRAPLDARVKLVRYSPGRFLDVRDPRCPAENASNLVGFEGALGPFAVRQVAGLIARRIVCPGKEGDAVARGQRMGMIKFGSRTELLVPADARVKVETAVGRKVRGGETVILSYVP